MSASHAFEEIGYRIEDGDIGYAGNSHASFVTRPVERTSRATETGSAACRALVSFIATRFAKKVEGVRGQLGVSSAQYQAARRRIVAGQ